MWPWIFRLIALLLALIGSALGSLLIRPLRARAEAVMTSVAPAFLLDVGLFGVALVALALVLAAATVRRDATLR
ncbi:MAG TPA: hypothetical protein VMT68_12615 [Caulobacteraceae bacterium]|nr:hypothetical protein [Caulobacteraceae bacterium]